MTKGAAGLVPTHDSVMWPMLLSVAELGGSGSISEISDAVIKRQRYSDALQAVLHQDGPQTKIDYRLAWAHSHLKMAWFLINSSRGIWSLTEAGDDLVRVGEPDGPPQVHGRPSFEHCGDHPPVEPQAPRDQEPVVLGPVGIQTDREEDWKSQLLESLMAMDPGGFERLAQRLLREADFISVNVTGRSGDGGIDGLGNLPAFVAWFPCVLSVQAGECRIRCGPRLPRGDGRPRGQRPIDHYRHVYRGRQGQIDPGWNATRGLNRRRGQRTGCCGLEIWSLPGGTPVRSSTNRRYTVGSGSSSTTRTLYKSATIAPWVCSSITVHPRRISSGDHTQRRNHYGR